VSRHDQDAIEPAERKVTQKTAQGGPRQLRGTSNLHQSTRSCNSEGCWAQKLGVLRWERLLHESEGRKSRQHAGFIGGIHRPLHYSRCQPPQRVALTGPCKPLGAPGGSGPVGGCHPVAAAAFSADLCQHVVRPGPGTVRSGGPAPNSRIGGPKPY
jgi:hypothetical protein